MLFSPSNYFYHFTSFSNNNFVEVFNAFAFVGFGFFKLADFCGKLRCDEVRIFFNS